MILTDERISVTWSMLRNANMTKGVLIGVPIEVNDLSKGLRWKGLPDLTEEDFDAIEQYFINKTESL